MPSKKRTTDAYIAYPGFPLTKTATDPKNCGTRIKHESNMTSEETKVAALRTPPLIRFALLGPHSSSSAATRAPDSRSSAGIRTRLEYLHDVPRPAVQGGEVFLHHFRVHQLNSPPSFFDGRTQQRSLMDREDSTPDKRKKTTHLLWIGKIPHLTKGRSPLMNSPICSTRIPDSDH